MDFKNMTCKEFAEALASKAPVPGGGGASAMAGALGAALGEMVGNLTVGKKKYADVEDDVKALMARSESLRGELLEFMRKDAEAFEPLAAAYGLPKETEEERARRDEVMEDALVRASEVPLELMEKCCEAIAVHEELAEKGAVLAVSDVGVGVLLCRAALLGASLNVFINTKMMRDREAAGSLNARAEGMIARYVPAADRTFDRVREKL